MEIRENVIFTDVDSRDIPSWKFLLKNLNFEKINNQFEIYQDLCLRYPTSFARITNCIDSLFNVQYLNHDFFPHFKHTITSQKDEKSPDYFFRIRKVENRLRYDIEKEKRLFFETLEFEDLKVWSDVWEKPSYLVNHYQRLSKPQTSVLYTSLMTSTALLETNIKQGDMFFLIVYKSKRAINYSDCCNFIYYNNLSEDENLKRYIIFQFLRNEFTRVLPDNAQYEIQYCTAEAISKKFFVSDNSDAIQYPSTRGIGHKNVAFWSNSIHECLDLIGFRCCFLNSKYCTEGMISVFADGFWNSNSKKFEYYSLDSVKSKEIFGNIVLKSLINK